MNPISSFELLESCPNLAVAYVSEDDQIADTPLTFVLNSLSCFQMGQYTTIRSFLPYLDHQSAIVSNVGYAKYENEILSACLAKPINHQPRTFLLPLLDGEHTTTILMSMYYDEKGDRRVFVFLLPKLASYDLNYMAADAFQDRLTGLFNYFTLKSHLKANSRHAYLSLFDLNKFKQVNDEYGHEVGDFLLKTLADHFIDICRDEVIFYRRSGDEFFFLYFCDTPEPPIALAKRIDEYLKSKLDGALKDYPHVGAGASFGIIELAYHENKEENLFREENFFDACILADIAMYQAKTKKQTVVLLSEAQEREIYASGSLHDQLRRLASAPRS